MARLLSFLAIFLLPLAVSSAEAAGSSITGARRFGRRRIRQQLQ